MILSSTPPGCGRDRGSYSPPSLFAFLLIFLPLADSFSVDALLRSCRGHKPGLQPRPAWALRLIQIQMVLIFWATAWEKLRGEEWVDGTAFYYVARVEDLFGRFPMPGIFFEWMPAIQVMTWSVLLIELLVPVLIWFRETRTFTIVAVVLFHLGIDYTMNLFLFEWLMILGWLTFATPDDLRALQRAWVGLRNRFAALVYERATVQRLAGGGRIGVSQASRKS